MQRPNIKKLARLSRLELTADEEQQYANELADILQYVKQVQDIAGDETLVPDYDETVVKNVFRDDEDVHEAGAHTEKLLAEASMTKDGFIQVKKIIDND